MANKTLTKMQKETNKLEKAINSLTESKDTILADIKNKSDYKKKLDQSVNAFKALETPETKKMIDNLEKEIGKINNSLNSLNEKKDELTKEIKSSTDLKKKLDQYSEKYRELLDELDITELEFYDCIEKDSEKKKQEIQNKNRQVDGNVQNVQNVQNNESTEHTVKSQPADRDETYESNENNWENREYNQNNYNESNNDGMTLEEAFNNGFDKFDNFNNFGNNNY